MKRVKRVGLTVKSDLDCMDEIVQRVLTLLKSEHVDVCVDQKRLQQLDCVRGLPDIDVDIELLIVIGGDGTIFRAVRELPSLAIPLLSVNRGAVGFLSETNIHEVEELFPLFLHGEGTIEERSLLSIDVLRAGTVTFSGRALNDAVIAQGAISRLIDLKTTIDDEPLATYHADGLIIATPTGSTAYSLAAGGPIVHPRLSAIILTPINPHSFTQKPIVIPATHVVKTEVLKRNTGYDSEVSLTLDGQVYYLLDRFDVVQARIHPESVKFLRRKQDTFAATLRTKLKWGERLED